MNLATSSSASGQSEKVSSAVSSGRKVARRPIMAATPGDHPDIEQFLAAVFQGPPPEEFKSSLEDPFYEPYDRLLIKDGFRITAHVHLTRRTMQFGSLRIPTSGLSWLGVLPEMRGLGLGRRLLTTAENQMAAHGAMIGLLRTRIPHFFRRSGWAWCGRHSYSQAGPRALLSRMLAGNDRPHCHDRLHVRCWRRLELAALMRIYGQNLPGRFGPFERTEAYWEWLMQRHGYDQLYVVLRGPNVLELEEKLAPIVGYAVARGDRIVELLSAPSCKSAALKLLARACRDAIEHGYHHLELHAPFEHQLHALFQAAGGSHHVHETDRDEVLMARVLQPVRFLRMLGPELVHRSRAAGLLCPLELGLVVEAQRYRLVVHQEHVEVSVRRESQNRLHLNVADFTRMVLGQLDWRRAYDQGCVRASNVLAREAAPLLFPKLSFWRPPWDDLPARGGGARPR